MGESTIRQLIVHGRSFAYLLRDMLYLVYRLSQLHSVCPPCLIMELIFHITIFSISFFGFFVFFTRTGVTYQHSKLGRL